MNLSKIVKWKHTAGIELTFVPTKKKVRKIEKIDAWCYEHALDLRDKYVDSDKNKGIISHDPECVEHSSPILKSWKHARNWWEDAVYKAHTVSMTTYRDDVVGGGGHIHIEADNKAAFRMYCDMMYRPYVAFACISPYDTVNALPCHHSRNPVLQQPEYFRHFGYNILRRRDFSTIEWRAFDSAADWDIQECHLAMVHRYRQKIEMNEEVLVPRKQSKFGNVYAYETMHRILKITYPTVDTLIVGFSNFVVDYLELPWKSYSWMVDRNLVPAYERKKVWLEHMMHCYK